MNTKHSYRKSILRLGIAGAALLCNLAFSPSAEANSCNVSIVLPTNMSSTVCGASVTTTVPYAVTDDSGTATALAQATLGQLHALTSVTSTVPTATFFPICCNVVSQIGVNTNGDTFTFTDLVVSGPVGTTGTFINVSFNIALSGGVIAPTTGTDMLAQSGMSMSYSLAGTSGQGGVFANNGGGFSASGILNGVVTGQGTTNNVQFSTATATVQVGTPFSFSLGMSEASIAGPTSFCSVSCVGTADPVSNFYNTLGLPTTGPVANLPAGFTLNSASGLILNNQFTPPSQTPEPSTLLLLGSGLMAMVGAARRRLFN